MAAARFHQSMLGVMLGYRDHGSGIRSKGLPHRRISAANHNSLSSGSQDSTLTLNLCQVLRAGSVV
jgi:hypothetical protein